MAGRKQAVKRRKTPVRTCIVCRQTDDKRQLIRIVRGDTSVQIDPTGKQNGRGAYVCQNRSGCNGKLTPETVNRALRTTISQEDWEALQRQLMDA